MKTLIATSLLALASTAVLAPNAAYAAEEDVFTGVHIGVEAGWESREIDGSVPAGSTNVTLQDKRENVYYAAIAGYDQQIGPVVIGVEAGLSKAGKTLRAPIGATGTLAIDPECRLDLSARAGVTVAPRVLAFGRAGYTLERQRISGLVDAQNTPVASDKVTTDGVSYGGGLEYAFAENFSVRAEYRRTELDGAQHGDRVLVGLTGRF